MKSLPTRFLLFLAFHCFMHLCFSKISRPIQVSYDNRAVLINGKRKLIISGSIHYSRSTSTMWPDLIEKAKQGGLNAIDTSVFWNAHEPLYRQYDFSGKLNFIRFITTIHDHGMYAIIRIGPYVSAGLNYGGFPEWLHNIPGIELRTNNKIFKNEMKNFTTLIVEKLKSQNLFASQGGPIILAQIENAYGNIEPSYVQESKKYVQWCIDLAISYRIGVPWIMYQESDDIRGVILTCNGYYCDQFWPGHGMPKMWTETWTTSPRNRGTPNSYRATEDLSFAVGRFFQYGGSLQNYYMYYGGTNFGQTSGGPYPFTSYDFNALLRADVGMKQPTWGHLKQLHEILLANEKILTYGVSRNIDYGNQTTATIYSYNGKKICFFGNAHQRQGITIDYEYTKLAIPAWSISILTNCDREVYNTAKVNVNAAVNMCPIVLYQNKSCLIKECTSTCLKFNQKGIPDCDKKGPLNQNKCVCGIPCRSPPINDIATTFSIPQPPIPGRQHRRLQEILSLPHIDDSSTYKRKRQGGEYLGNH